MPEIPWGPNGQAVYERTYRRARKDGSMETWPDTVARVVAGNLSLVYGEKSSWTGKVWEEYNELFELIHDMKAIPAGRHLWASGVEGRQFLFNCHVSGWTQRLAEARKVSFLTINAGENEAKLSDHFTFQFLRSMEGGGVGTNYSSRYLKAFGPVRQHLRVHIVCDSSHPDYADMKAAGVLSDEYSADWPGAFEVADSREGWAEAYGDLIDTYFRPDVKHENRVYDVTNVRAKGARLKTFGGTASGPQPLAELLKTVERVLNRSWGYSDHVTPLEAMEVDHAAALAAVAGGVRRTARMSMVHWKDPYVFEFISSKAQAGQHWSTNISVEIDQEFTDLVSGDPWYESPLKGHALEVLRAVVTGMLTNGEPGFWNSSLSNVGEPNPVICTNPCGEIALEPWENCNLGHVNLDAFHDDFEGALRAHQLMARFLIRATYGDVNDEKQAAVLARNRRIGVGHFGFQGWLVKQGVRYSDSHRDYSVIAALSKMKQAVRDEARSYCFELRIPECVKVTTVAPTGTIAKLCGRTEGIHPILFRYAINRVRYSIIDPAQREQVLSYMDQGYRCEVDVYDPSGNTWVVEFPVKNLLVEEIEAMGLDPELVEEAGEIALADMLAVQAMYQAHYADNAVSFTVNVPAEPHQVEAMKGLKPVPPPSDAVIKSVTDTLARYLPSLKGTTLMVDGSRPQAPYERLTREQYEAFGISRTDDGVDEECANGACPVR